MPLQALERPSQARLDEYIYDTKPISEVGKLTLAAYQNGLLSDIDPQVARDILAYAASHELQATLAEELGDFLSSEDAACQVA